MRFLVQRSQDGVTWWTLTGADERKDAEVLCNQRATRGKQREAFRVVDVAHGTVTFEVLNG